eukprot:8566935-Alexandrium_andersonii.AAC.1
MLAEQRTSWRVDVEHPGCWERADTKRQPSPNTPEARRQPSQKLAKRQTSNRTPRSVLDSDLHGMVLSKDLARGIGMRSWSTDRHSGWQRRLCTVWWKAWNEPTRFSKSTSSR